jgi:hypothetical protein
VTAEGVSNPVLLLVDDLPSVAEAADNHAPEQAQAVAWPAAVEGQCEEVQEDYYRIRVEVAARLSFEVVAQRLGSKLDPVLTLQTAAGQELAKSDDADGVGGDSRLVYTFEAAGDYLVCVRDVRHAGGPDYRYRLRIGTFPLLMAVYPLGGRAGEVASLAATGLGTDPHTLLHIALPPAGSSAVNVGVAADGKGGSGWIAIEAGALDDVLQQEPNDEPAAATRVALPCAINGRFDQAGDIDHYRFTAAKGQRLRFTARTRDLGADGDVFLRLLKADGAQLAVGGQQRPAALECAAPDDGDYVLQVEDLLVGGEGRHSYRIHGDNADAGFSLSAEHAQYSPPRGGVLVIKVMASRHGYEGPIALELQGLEAASIEGGTFEGNETLLKITLPAGLESGQLRRLSILARPAQAAPGPLTRANQWAAVAAMYPNTPVLPGALLDAIAVGVGPPFPPFFELSVAGGAVHFPQLVGAASFEVSITRTSDAFKDPVAIAVEGLPSGVTAEIAPVDDGLKAMRVSLKGPTDLAEGEHTLRITGRGVFQDQPRTVVLEEVKLRVTKPLVATLTMAGPLVQGSTQQAEIRVQRFGDDPQSVHVRFIDGPPGLSAPIALTIAADQSQASAALSADAAAPTGTFDNLAAQVSTTVGGQAVVVVARAAIEIQPPAAP